MGEDKQRDNVKKSITAEYIGSRSGPIMEGKPTRKISYGVPRPDDGDD